MSHVQHGSQPVNEPSANETVGALAITNIILGCLILVVGGGFIYARFFHRPTPDPEQLRPYLAEAQERLDDHADEIGDEAAELAEELLAPVSKAIYAQARGDYPMYIRVLETQGDEFLTNVEQMFVEKVKANYRDYVRAHRDVIKEEFPEYASDTNVELVLEDFKRTIDGMIERYYLDEFRREAKRTVTLWNKFAPLEMPGPGEPSLEEQLVDYTADWTVLAVADEVPAAAENSSESSLTGATSD